ncbi:acetylcholinesterase-like [Emys orbicularis]|uniref:acetylcholinesterase-like n=1 Tax=Emys orbicularis TaxID=82168 RepID=UPI0031FDE578
MLGLLPTFPCLLLLSLPGPSSGSDDDGTVVLTTSGPIRGKRLPAGSSTVTAFLGIPYAEPPMGALRFQKPLPHQPWSHVLETTSFGNVCHQPPVTGYPQADVWTPKAPQSEDCLFLNVWVPHPHPNGTAPILVWIHGGGFFTGAASLEIYDGRFLAATENVIVASMNYRLGALGFLSLPPAAPGNAGLWDQRLAARWLQDNVAAFGGDPARFLLFGQGTGAASVGFHLLSPGSRPLFTRAVLQSGAPNAPWAWISLEEAKERGQRLGQLLGCSDGNSTALVGCLQGKEPREFPKHEFSILNHKKELKLPFVPTPDGDFLPDTPPRLLQARHGQPIPIAAGFTTNEGSYILYFAASSLNLDNASSIGWEELLQVVRLIVPGVPDEAIQAMARWYIQEGEEQGEARYRWAMEQIAGDYVVVCPILEMARQETEAGNPVYTYHFAHRSSGLSAPEWMGVPQGSEMPYEFGTLASVVGSNHTEAEVALSRRAMHYLAVYTWSGKPMVGEGSEQLWPTYDPAKQNFERISLKPPEAEKASPASRCEFLASLLSEKPKAPESQAGGTIQCERCLLVEFLRKQVGELQEEVARLRSICAHEEFIDSIHMETSKAEGTIQIERTAVMPPGEEDKALV